MLFNGSILANSSTSHDPPYSVDSIRHDHLDECGDTHLSISSKPPYTRPRPRKNSRPASNDGLLSFPQLSHRQFIGHAVDAAVFGLLYADCFEQEDFPFHVFSHYVVSQ
jgi:hypothetical protein